MLCNVVCIYIVCTKMDLTQTLPITCDSDVQLAIQKSPQIIEPPATNSQKPRVIISKVVLENFKSYGGVKVIGPFHKKFSSIVGPNGSGKSNVIDAMLFVFGRRAKDLRLSKVSELIHNSHMYTKDSLECAKVSVHFEQIIDRIDSCDDYDIIKNGGFVISRVASKSNTSQYYINDTKSTQKEVVNLLKLHKIDLDHNRFLILQGEVEQISMMKPKAAKPEEEGLLEYLEDIIGSNQHLPQIEKEEHTLEEACHNFTEKRNRVNIVKKELEALEGPRAEAEKYCNKEKRLLNMKAEMAQIKKHDVVTKLEGIEKKHRENKNKWDEWKKERAEDDNEKTKVESDVQHKRKEAIVLQSKVDAATSEYDKLDTECNTLNTRLSNCKKRIQKGESELKNMKRETLQCEADAVQCEKDEKLLRKDLPLKREEHETLNSKLEQLEESLQVELESLRDSKEVSEKALAPLHARENENQKTHTLLQSKAHMLEEQQKRAQSGIQKTKEKIDTLTQTLTAKKTDVAHCHKTLTQHKKTMQKKRTELDTLQGENESAVQKLIKQKSKTEEKERQYKDGRQTDKLVCAIMEAKDNGILRGVVDRLWNLGSIDDKYDLAFSAVAASEYIVTNTTEDAQGVVEFVRSNNLGRVTCIVLEKVETELRGAFKKFTDTHIPAGAVRLIDLVRNCEKQFQVAFFYAIRDTLVADDLSAARKIAFGSQTRWQVVTLEGQRIDKAGTMTGGKAAESKFKNAKKNNTQKVSVKEIEKLKEEIRDMSARVDGLKNKKQSLQNELDDLDSDMNSLDSKRVQLEPEIENIQKQITQNEEFLKTAVVPEMNREDASALENIHKQLSLHLREMSNHTIEYEKQKATVQKISQQMKEVGGDQRKQLKEKVDALQKECEESQKKVDELSIKAEVLKQKAKDKTEAIPKKKKRIGR